MTSPRRLPRRRRPVRAGAGPAGLRPITRPRQNPHGRSTPEHLLYARWKRALANAESYQRHATVAMWSASLWLAAVLQASADAERTKADHYAKALTALGHPPAPLRLEGPK